MTDLSTPPKENVYDAGDAARYDAAIPIYPGEIDFYLGLAREAQAKGLATLDLACGTGRIGVPLAREGIRLVGLDLSAEMLAAARQKSAGLETAEWVEGDMRAFELTESFGLVIIPGGSFHLLLTTEDQLACLRCIHQHLAAGGRLAFSLDNPDIVAMGQWLSIKRGLLQRRGDREYRDPETGRMIRSWETRSYRPSIQEEELSSVNDQLDDDDTVVSRAYGSMRIRYIFRFEMEHMLARCGLEAEAVFGDFSGGEFRGNSQAMVWVARRPA